MRNLIWFSSVIGFAAVLTALLYLDYGGTTLEGMDGVSLFVFIATLVAVSALLHRFVHQNFDECGRWIGRFF